MEATLGGGPTGRPPGLLLAADPSLPTMEAARRAASGSVPGPMHAGLAVRAPTLQGVTTGQAASPSLGAKGRRLAVRAPPGGHRRYCGPSGGGC